MDVTEVMQHFQKERDRMQAEHAYAEVDALRAKLAAAADMAVTWSGDWTRAKTREEFLRLAEVAFNTVADAREEG
jgi:hypothetical protein